MTYCKLNSVSLLNRDYSKYNLVANKEYTCYHPEEGQFIDWVKMEAHGLIETSDCSSSNGISTFNDLQKVLSRLACPTMQGSDEL